MGESIFSAFEIKLFGRLMDDLVVRRPTTAENPDHPGGGVGPGKPAGARRASFKDLTDFDDSLLGQQVKGQNSAANAVAPMPQLARIYGFSFEGQYYLLPKPTIFLVHGPGHPLDIPAIPPIPPAPPIPAQLKHLLSAFKNVGGGARSSVEESGVAARDWYFEDDIKMWTYDKSAMSIRFDLTSGKFEDILLEATLATMSRMASREGELASREGELASREGELASREGEMAARSGEMAFRARHRFK